MSQSLVRPRDGRMIAGVCVGIARRFDVPPWVVRALFVASLFLPGPQVLLYLVLWIFIPQQ